MSVDESLMCSFQILKPSEKKAKYQYTGLMQKQNVPSASTGNERRRTMRDSNASN